MSEPAAAPAPIRLDAVSLALLWGGLAAPASLAMLASGMNVAPSALDIVTAIAFWAAFGALVGGLARRFRARWLEARPLLGWTLAVAAWASLEAAFTVVVVIKPTRWPPLAYSAVGIVLPWLLGAALGAWALRRAATGRRLGRVHPAVVLAATWATLGTLTHWLPRWIRAFVDAPALGWLGWGALDLLWLLAGAVSTTCVAIALLRPRHARLRPLALAIVLAGLQLMPPLLRGASPPQAPRADAPDLVWIMIDGVRADHVDAYGYGRPTMPTLAALAARGTLVHGHVSAGVRTENTYAKMLLLDDELAGYERARPVPLSAARDLVPAGWLPTQGGLLATLERAGYETALIHTYHDLLEDRGLQPWLQTFDHVLATRRSGDASLGTYLARMVLGDRLDGVPRMDRWAAHRRRYLAERTATETATYLAHRERRPLFLIVHLAGGHVPYYTFGGGPRLPGPVPANKSVAQYDEAIRAADDQLAVVLAAVAAQLRDPRVFVFADHGEKLKGEPTLPGSVTVPLVVTPPLPAAPVGVTTSQDIVATTLAMAAGTAPRCGGALARDLRCPPADVARVVDHTGHRRLVLAQMQGTQLVAIDVQPAALAAGRADGTTAEGCELLREFFSATAPALVPSPLEVRDGLGARLAQALARCAAGP